MKIFNMSYCFRLSVRMRNIFYLTPDGATVNNAKVEEADVAVTNGVIHVIDTVLLPPTFDASRI